MKVNCLSCGFKIDLGDAYDDYDGLVKCFVCQAVLAVKSEAGSLTSVLLGTAPAVARTDDRRDRPRQPAPTSRAALEQS